MLAAPDTITGPLTAADLDRATVAKCPPCHGMCHQGHQGRQCSAQGASACSELLEDDKAERRMTVAGYFWAVYLVLLLLAVGAGIAHFLPALKALVNN